MKFVLGDVCRESRPMNSARSADSPSAREIFIVETPAGRFKVGY